MDETISRQDVQFSDSQKQQPSNTKAVVQVNQARDRGLVEQNNSYEEGTIFDETTFEDYEVVD